MRILVTGGTGRIGSVTVQRLLRHGHDVHTIDMQPEAHIEGATYSQCDITNFDHLREEVRGCDAIIHLAAYPSPVNVPGHEVFRVNVSGTYNVFEAAAKEGIKRIAQASSINALGSMWWGCIEPDIQYFPLDEEHPTDPTDPYSYSKTMVEEVGRYYWRRDKIANVGFRFPAVWPHDRIIEDVYKEGRLAMRAALDELAALSATERQQKLADVKALVDNFRQQRYMEYEAKQAGNLNPPWDDILWRAYGSDRYNMWTYIDVEDAAQALEKAVTVEFEGSHPLFTHAVNNAFNYDVNTLLDIFFPEVTARKRELSGIASPISIDAARKLIGFEPEFSLPVD